MLIFVIFFGYIYCAFAALETDGSVVCWGLNEDESNSVSSGKLYHGAGVPQNTRRPTRLPLKVVHRCTSGYLGKMPGMKQQCAAKGAKRRKAAHFILLFRSVLRAAAERGLTVIVYLTYSSKTQSRKHSLWRRMRNYARPMRLLSARTSPSSRSVPNLYRTRRAASSRGCTRRQMI